MIEILMLGTLVVLVIIAHNIKVVGEKLDRSEDGKNHLNDKHRN